MARLAGVIVDAFPEIIRVSPLPGSVSWRVDKWFKLLTQINCVMHMSLNVVHSLLAASHLSPRKHLVHSFHSDQSALFQHKCRRACTTSMHFHVHVWSGHYFTDHIWCQVQYQYITTFTNCYIYFHWWAVVLPVFYINVERLVDVQQSGLLPARERSNKINVRQKRKLSLTC